MDKPQYGNNMSLLNKQITMGTKKVSLILLIISPILAIIIGLIVTAPIDKHLSELFEKHHLVHLEDSFRGKITDHEFQKEIYLTLNDTIHIYFYSMDNKMYKPIEFYKFIHNNDILEKHANSDTIYLYRENQRYYFIMDDLHEYLYKNGQVKRKRVLKQ